MIFVMFQRYKYKNFKYLKSVFARNMSSKENKYNMKKDFASSTYFSFIYCKHF